jgi:hypothetical protein
MSTESCSVIVFAHNSIYETQFHLFQCIIMTLFSRDDKMFDCSVSSQSLIIENSFPVDDLLGDRVDDDKQHSNPQQLQGLTQQYPTPTTTTSHPQVKARQHHFCVFFAAVLSCLSFPSYPA